MSDKPVPEDGSNDSMTKKIPVIHHDMLDKMRFYPLVIVSNVSIRAVTFPFINLTTKLQAQRGSNMYSSLWDCVVKTKQQEGLAGFYKGGAVRILGQIPSSFVYITTLEKYKYEFLQILPNNAYLCSAGAGMLAACAGQLIGNPIEIVSQTLILMSKGDQKAALGKNIDLIDIPEEVRQKKGLSRVISIFHAVYKQRGPLGFWKGYPLSAITMAIGSALWWPLYFFLSDVLYTIPVLENHLPLLAIKSMAAILGGCCTTLITNPIDLIRLRLQMEESKFGHVLKKVWKEEKLFAKAIVPRLMHSATFSFFAIFGYEFVKWVSLHEDYTIPL